METPVASAPVVPIEAHPAPAIAGKPDERRGRSKSENQYRTQHSSLTRVRTTHRDTEAPRIILKSLPLCLCASVCRNTRVLI